jgi:hypothetical protein
MLKPRLHLVLIRQTQLVLYSSGRHYRLQGIRRLPHGVRLLVPHRPTRLLHEVKRNVELLKDDLIVSGMVEMHLLEASGIHRAFLLPTLTFHGYFLFHDRKGRAKHLISGRWL